MINQLNSVPTISQNIMDEIEKLKPFIGGEWDIKNNADITQFKESLKSQLLAIQDQKCAYCGLPFEETGKTEIEHFAPKGGSKRPRHPEFAFTVNNLVLSCNLCNSPVKKGNYDTIEVKNADYGSCTFKIVHPYFDDHSLHYAWTNDSKQVLIQGISVKGLESIRVFKLDSTRHSEARTRIKVHAYLLTLSDGAKLIADALNYKP